MTEPAQTKIWPFPRRRLPSLAKWLKDRTHGRAHAQLAELRSAMDRRHSDLTRRIEVRAQVAVQEAVEEAATALQRALEIHHSDLIRHIEVRAHAAVQEAANANVSGTAELRKMIEMRAQIAAGEAKSYADHGLGALSKSLAASNRIVVNAMKQIGATAHGASSMRAMAPVWQEDAQRLAALEERVASRLDLVPGIIDARLQTVDAKLEGIEKSVLEMRDAPSVQTELGGRLEAIDRELGRIVSDYNAQLRNAEKRIEFIRSETMYEVQALGYRASSKATPAQTAARIVNPTKVDAMRETGLRLNVGCGHIQLDDYLNVDGRALPGVDVVADATDIPFGESELAEIRSSHLVEHFTPYILDRVLLPHWSSLLRRGGVLTTIAPDGAAMLQAVNNGDMEFTDFREVLFGGQDYDGDFHYNLLTPQTFSDSLRLAGFEDIVQEYVGMRNGKCFEFKISCKKA